MAVNDCDVTKSTPEIERLLSHAEHFGRDPDRCWIWTGADKGNGYGHTSKGPAHRRSYELFVGPIPPRHDVCHECDTRPCINPRCLFPGTRKQNMEDCKRKGRHAHGERHSRRFRGENGPGAKLSWPKVRAIRASSNKSSELALEYGVTVEAINCIRRHATWKE